MLRTSKSNICFTAEDTATPLSRPSATRPGAAAGAASHCRSRSGEAELPPGDYRLHVGLYLLATMERLPVLDAGGVAVDDKIEVLIR